MKQEPKAIKYQSKTHRKLHTLINRVNEDTLMAAHKRQVADKATGIDGVTKDVYVVYAQQRIPKELYMMVQEEMVRRANLETGTGKRRIYSGKYALSSIVFCGHCGDVFQRTHWNIRGRKKMVWRCVSRLHKKDRDFDCPARTVTELELQVAVVQAVNEVYAKQEVLLPQIKENIERALANNNSGPVAELNDRIAVLEEEILQRSRARQDLDNLGKEVIKLKEEKYRLQLEDLKKKVCARNSLSWSGRLKKSAVRLKNTRRCWFGGLLNGSQFMMRNMWLSSNLALR